MPLPEPLPLEPPPGDPAALDDLTRRLSGAVFALGILETSLHGPAGTAPGWIGADADAAAARVAAVAALVRDAAAAVWQATGRLRAHRELLEEIRDRIRALAAAQEEDYTAAWGRLAALPDPATAVRAGDPAAVAVAEGIAHAEAVRGRQHAALLAEAAADARATAQVLATCSVVVGGTGRSGDAGRAVAYLALALPEWGSAELALRGEQLAQGLLGQATAAERDALAVTATSFAGDPAFARAFLTALGADGVGLLLLALGSGQYDQDSAIAAVLAAALGGAVPTGSTRDPVRDVHTATYVGSGERYGSSDTIAAGMAAVLAAGGTGPGAGLPPDTVARWAGQMLRREHEQGLYAGAGAVPQSWDGTLADPAAVALAVLVRTGASEEAATLLSATDVWQTLLSRAWTDGGTTLADTITLVAQEPGGIGDDAVRAGLTAIGGGLFEGDPSDWTVSRRTVAGAAPALADAVAAHVAVAVDELWVGVDGTQCLGASPALRGLGYLTVDRDAARVVGHALYGWATGQPAVVPDAGAPSAAVAVPSAYLATQEYGQRLSYTLDTYEAQEAAEHRAAAWNWSVGLVPDILPGYWGTAAGLVEGYAAIVLGADGTWEDAPDTGLAFDAGGAVEEGLERAGDSPAVAAAEIARQARGAFERTAAALGDPAPVESPESELLQPILDTFASEAGNRRRPGSPRVTP
jgi:hypothetical protein